MGTAFQFALLAACVSALALAAIVRFGCGVRRISKPLSIAAGGMLLMLVAVHIAPEALAASERAWIFMVAGFVLGPTLQWVSRSLVQWQKPPLATEFGGAAGSEPAPWSISPGLVLAAAPLLAIAIHSFLDGIVYSVAFAGGHASGVYAASALVIHEVPEAFVAFALASSAGMSVRGAALAAFVAAAVTTPLGAAASGPALAAAGDSAIPLLFAMSAGLLSYVALGPLLAPLYASGNRPTLGGVAALGAGLVAASVLLAAPVPHGAIDGDTGAVHAHAHEHSPGDGHYHPNFSPFR